MGNTVFRLGVFSELVGESGAGKTALLHEMERWHIYNSSGRFPYNPTAYWPGAAKHLVAEPRYSPELAESITGFPPNGSPYFSLVDDIKVAEDWTGPATNWVKMYEDKAKAKDPIICASCIGQDSLTAVTTRKESDEAWASGEYNPNFSQIAKSLNQFFKILPARMAVFPINFIATNHQKTSKNPQGYLDRREPGGTSVKFGATTMIRVECRGKSETLKESARKILLTNQKNSLSAAGSDRTLYVSLKWKMDPSRATVSNPQGQVSIWDWEAATVELLLSIDGVARRKAIDSVIEFRDVVKETQMATCPALGITKKTSWHEIGAALCNFADPKVIKINQALDKLLGVTARACFVPGQDYAEQQARALSYGSTILVDGDGVEMVVPGAPQDATVADMVQAAAEGVLATAAADVVVPATEGQLV